MGIKFYVSGDWVQLPAVGMLNCGFVQAYSVLVASTPALLSTARFHPASEGWLAGLIEFYFQLLNCKL